MSAVTPIKNLEEDPGVEEGSRLVVPWSSPGQEPTPGKDDSKESSAQEASNPDWEPHWRADSGATTAEYAITTLAACGFAALLVVVLKSGPIKELVTGIIQNALGLGN